MAPIPIASRLQVFKTVAKGRWFVVAVGIVVLIASAGAYSFSVYSQKLKSALGINQENLNLIANFKDLGVNFGLFSGLLYDYWSPGGVLFLGALETAAGYSLAWLAVTKKIPPSLWQMCLFLLVGANSQSMLNTAVLVQCVKLFPASKGAMIALLKGYIGISGAILIQIYITICGSENPDNFILMLVWLPSAVALLSILVIRPLPPFRGLPQGKHIYWLLGLGFVLAFYLMGVSVAQNLMNLSTTGEQAIGIILLILIFIPLLFITFQSEVYGKKSCEDPSTSCELFDVLEHPVDRQSFGTEQRVFDMKEDMVEASKDSKSDSETEIPISANGAQGSYDKEHLRPDEVAETNPRRNVDAELDSKPAEDGHIKGWPRKGEDHTIWQTYRCLDFWLLFIATTFGVGSGLTVTDNMGQLGLSLGYSSSKVGTFVSLVSIWNAIGRWVGGFLSDILLRRYGFSRAMFLMIMMTLMSLAFLLIAINVPGCLYFGSIFLGLSFGAQYPLYATIVADIFGLKYYATLYNSIGLASPVGMYLLSVPVVGRYYDDEAKKELSESTNVTSNNSNLVCLGSSCFGRSLLVLIGVTVGAAVSAGALWYRTRNLYREVQEKYQQSIRDADGDSPKSRVVDTKMQSANFVKGNV